jgi:hypothetical protein
MKKYLELFDGAFDSTVADKIKPENKPYVAYSKTEGVVYTIIPKEDGTMYTIYRVVSKDISNCTYNMVDLGLSVKWADRNVGATSPEHYGSYFQWGDTNAYTFDGVGEITAFELAEMFNPILGPQLEMEITADNVGMILEQIGMTGTDLTLMGIGGVLGKFFNWDSYNEVDVITGWTEYENGYRDPTGFKKYNNSESGLKVLESIDDAATAHMGSQYRMPTIEEIEELIDNTTQSFIDIDGNEYDRQYAYDNEPIEQGKLKGVKFTSSNGNSIFIPAAGECIEVLLKGANAYGSLWSSSLPYGDDWSAWYWLFDYGGYVNQSGDSRYRGLSVRGVQA